MKRTCGIDEGGDVRRMNAHYIQHVPFEGLGAIADWFEENDYKVTRSAMFEGDGFPSVEEIDFLVVVGGPMNIYEYEKYPWLKAEKEFIKAAIDAGKPVLGLCLGAQLIADVLGSRTVANKYKEIGWLPVQKVSDRPDVFQFPAEMPMFHWHGETFPLPDGAVHLIKSESCAMQGFQYGRNVIGLQCHLEMTAESVEAIMEHCAEEMVEGTYIQSVGEIRANTERYAGKASTKVFQLLDYLHQA